MRYNTLLILLVFPLTVLSQVGGIDGFSFVNIEAASRSESMGGNLIAVYDYDVSLAQSTPSLLNKKMHNKIAFSFVDYFSDINLLAFSYAREVAGLGVLLIGVKSLNYGNFVLNENIGNTVGSFSAHDQVITLGIGKLLEERVSLGVSVNVLNSNYERYNSVALTLNLSATYNNPNKELTSTILVKNFGRQIIYYTEKEETLPFEVQFAISKGLAHLPFRYHISYNNINRFNIKSPYRLTTNTNLETGELEIKEESIAKTFLRHIIIGGELNPFRKNLFFRGGINFQRRFDMHIPTFPAMVGFSWGCGFKVYNFRLDYSRSSSHLSATPNNFSIATNLSIFDLQ